MEIIAAIVCFTFLIILLMAVILTVIYMFVKPAHCTDNELKLLYGVDFTKTKP